METRVVLDLAHAIAPLRAGVSADGALYDIIGDASVVLIGESTYGTYEFYRARTEITKRLIVDHDFTAVCVEGDWPGACRVNRFVRGAGDAEAIESLEDFKRFPTWRWRNPVILEFVAWLREYNDRAPLFGRSKTGFYGLDLYSTSAYYRTMLDDRQRAAKAVVWTHNETNAGALAREAFGGAAVSIGFTTYTGTVTAASEWNAPPERKRIVPARGDSYEYLFHSLNVPRFLVPLRPNRPKLSGLPIQARERAIGAIYRPQTDLDSHYFTARLIDQFDAVYHFDVTRALEPFGAGESWQRGELSESVPSGL